MSGALEILSFVAVLAVIVIAVFVARKLISVALSLAIFVAALFVLMLFWIPAPVEPWLGPVREGVMAPVEFVIAQIARVYGSVRLLFIL